ncbi:MAG: response regulator [Oscillochloris sp.]|nr:response regulator [Oscillochloris sp.]
MPTNKREHQRTPPTASEPSLRQRAETDLGAPDAKEQTARSPEESQRLLHELRIHQIELELQNEELRRTQEELERSRARYFDLYDLAPVGYVTLSALGLIQEANLTMASHLQVPRSSLHRQPLSRFIAPEDHDTYYQHQRHLRATGAPQGCELRLLRAEGAPLWVRMETTMVQDVANEAAVYRTVLSDITARVQAEAALRELNATLAERVDAQTAALTEREEHLRVTNAELARALRLKDEFLAMMSHELRTPLNVILGRSEALRESIYGPITAKQVEALHSIAESGQHLLSLITDILDLAKIETGKLALAYTIVDIGQICRTSLSLVEQLALTKRIRIKSTQDGFVDGVWGDARRLTQVLANLLSNAVKFTPEGGQVGLEVHSDEGERTLTFTVWDTGIGIAANNLPKLFQPFVQIDSSLSRQYEGTGLGLALVLRLTEAHGGSVAVESTLGQGSHFRVVLPWAPGASASDLLASTDDNTAMPVIGQVLVVEESVIVAEQAVRYLREFGARVEVCARGVGAVTRACALQPDVILLDLLLPDADGWEVLHRLKAEPRTRDIPVIVVSAVDEPTHGQALGAAALVRKPIDRAALVRALRRVGARLGAPPPGLAPIIPPGAQRPRILLAEDNQANSDALYDYLQAKGYTVTVARNGAEALIRAREDQPDAILMDIQMPVMDGLEAIRHIRADPALSRVPIIAVTALAMPGDRERCMATGADDYQTKPVNLHRLVAQIETLRHGHV